MDDNTVKLKLDSLHFNLVVIASFQIESARVQSQNNNNIFTVFLSTFGAPL